MKHADIIPGTKAVVQNTTSRNGFPLFAWSDDGSPNLGIGNGTLVVLSDGTEFLIESAPFKAPRMSRADTPAKMVKISVGDEIGFAWVSGIIHSSKKING